MKRLKIIVSLVEYGGILKDSIYHMELLGVVLVSLTLLHLLIREF